MTRPNTLRILAATAAALLATTATPRADETARAALERHGDKGVTARGIRAANNQSARLIEHDGDVLRIRGSYGEITTDVTPELARQMRVIPENAIQLDRMLRFGEFEEALPLLRQSIYPFLPFASLPDDFAQIHQPIETLFDVLMRLGRDSEIVFLFNQFPEVARQPTTRRAVRNALDDIRSQGDFQALIPAYRKLAEVDGEFRPQALAMLAYCQAQAGQTDQARQTLTQIKDTAEGDPAFSVVRFAQGFTDFADDMPTEALDQMAHGLVYANPIDGWIPEATYYIGNSYRQLENYQAALGAYEEVFKLNQNPAWAEKAKSAHAEVTEIVRKIKEEKERAAKAAAEAARAAQQENQSPRDNNTETPQPE